MKIRSLLPSILVAVAAACNVSATPVTVNFNTGGSVSSNSAGNVYTFNLNGIKVTLTSYSLSGNNNTTFQAGTLYQWSVGMGVCGANEGTNCSSPEHQIDNNGAVEMVLMQFSSPIDPTLITIQPYGTSSSGYDRDVTYYLGTGTGTINLSGKSLADLAALGFSSANNSDSTVSTAARSVAISGGAVTSLLFGAPRRQHRRQRLFQAGFDDGRLQPDPGTGHLRPGGPGPGGCWTVAS